MWHRLPAGLTLATALFVTACQSTGSGNYYRIALEPNEVPEVLRQGPYPPFIDLSKRQAELSKLSVAERRKVCRNQSGKGTAPNTYWREHPATTVEATGEIDRAKVNVQDYYNQLNQAIPLYLAGATEELPELKKHLVLAANMGAFEKIKPNNFGIRGYNANNELVYQQAMLLATIGMIYPELASVYGHDDTGISAIRNWGNRLFTLANKGLDDFKGNELGVDRAAAKAAGFVIWGTGANNPEAVKAGYAYFKFSTQESLANDGTLKKFESRPTYLYYGNMTYGWTVFAAEALVRAGLKNAYDLPGNGASVHGGVDWLLRSMINANHKITLANHSHGTRTLAWAEYYLARFPNADISIFMNNKIRRDQQGIYGGQSGGATTCMVKPL